ncbi:MAG: NAD(P)/FAD-dependent oxidoreductase, partial [Acidiferrobacterales bacterium]
TPELWRQIPRMLLDPLSPLMLRWQYLHRIAPWLLRFLAAGRRKRVEQTAAEMAPLVTPADKAHRALMKAHNIDGGLIRSGGVLKVFRDPRRLDATALERELLARHGIEVDVLDADGIHQLEPGLAHSFQSGLLYRDETFVPEPLVFTRAYADAFVSLGGRIQYETVRRFDMNADGPQKIVTDLGMHEVDRLVVAAGAWSRNIARMLGSDAPLDTERGYHLNVPWSDRITLNRPVFVVENYYYLCPMQDGVRVTSGAEFGGLDLPPDFRRIHRILQDARESLPGLDGEVTREWMGYRPSMPDSKPIICQSPHFDRVFFAFGHGHLGLTLSAVTGEAISDLIARRDSAIPLAPFHIDRF